MRVLLHVRLDLRGHGGTSSTHAPIRRYRCASLRSIIHPSCRSWVRLWQERCFRPDALTRSAGRCCDDDTGPCAEGEGRALRGGEREEASTPPCVGRTPRPQTRMQRVAVEIARDRVVIAVVATQHGSLVPLPEPVCDRGRLCRGRQRNPEATRPGGGPLQGSTDVLSARRRQKRSPGRASRNPTRVVHRARPVQGRQRLAPGLRRDRAAARMLEPLQLIRRESG